MATTKKAKKTTKKTAVKSKKTQMQSFKAYKETTPFMTFKVTDQTIYWTILFLMILALSLWVLSIQINISDILNNIT